MKGKKIYESRTDGQFGYAHAMYRDSNSCQERSSMRKWKKAWVRKAKRAFNREWRKDIEELSEGKTEEEVLSQFANKLLSNSKDLDG